MPPDCNSAEPRGIWEITVGVIRHPVRIFVFDWNWKAAVLSATFRAVLFAFATMRRGDGALRGVWIELVFRLCVSGFWGSLLQAYRSAEPVWLAGVFAMVVLPASAHLLEYLALRQGGASHIGAGMFISIAVTIGSLAFNWMLMRKGLFVTGKGTGTLLGDLRRLPGVLAGVFTP